MASDASAPAPLIALTPWRQTLNTPVDPENDLYTIGSEYFDSVTAAGGIPVLTPWVESEAAALDLLRRFDALVVTGGEDVDPARYGAGPAGAFGWNTKGDTSDSLLIQAAVELGLPVFAICRGLQIVNVTFGGTLHQHIHDTSDEHQSRRTDGTPKANADEHLARRHTVVLSPGSILSSVFPTVLSTEFTSPDAPANSVSVNSLHHQAADRIGSGLTVTAVAPDGIVEALEHSDHRLLAVQWHPERIGGEGHHVLFDWLVSQARTRVGAAHD